MTPRVQFRQAAEDDLEAIWDYVVQAAGRDKADALVRSLYDTTVLLAEQPLMGRAREDLRSALRSFVVRPYVIYYEALDERAGIAVVRIMRGERDVTPFYFR
ncbi:MAG: type II toxin-antitoxin system RelE/ParE family toxin [Bacteroidota bacterium]